MKKTIFVKGMHCIGCQNRIINVLSNINEIKKLDVNYETGKVVITINNNEILDKVIEQIEDLGFNVTGVE